MKTQEIIKALRTTTSRSKRALLDEAADRLEQLQKEKEALVADLKKLEETGGSSSMNEDGIPFNIVEESSFDISRVTIIWSTVHPAMRLTAILNGGERRMKRQIQDCWRNSREK